MRLVFWQPAQPPDRYAPDAFTELVGVTALLTDSRRVQIGTSRVTAIQVAAGGSGATWTVEVIQATAAARGRIMLAWPNLLESLPFTPVGVT